MLRQARAQPWESNSRGQEALTVKPVSTVNGTNRHLQLNMATFKLVYVYVVLVDPKLSSCSSSCGMQDLVAKLTSSINAYLYKYYCLGRLSIYLHLRF